jgi:4,5-DOPA dioxygenase extradiol
MTALEPGEAGAFMAARWARPSTRGFGRPRAVLAVSAHTLARRHVLLAGRAAHQAVHDFGGFPDALYQPALRRARARPRWRRRWPACCRLPA